MDVGFVAPMDHAPNPTYEDFLGVAHRLRWVWTFISIEGVGFVAPMVNAPNPTYKTTIRSPPLAGETRRPQ
jgi:hypothetical protein